MSGLTETQRVAVEQFRKKVDDVLTEEERLSEPFLLRWLIAREFDVARAEAMIRANVEWRKENDVEEVLRWEAPEVFRLYYTIGIQGFDKENCPIVIVPFGRMDVYGIITAGKKENFIRYTLQCLETALFRMKGKKSPSGEEVTKITVIFDFEHFSIRTLSYSGVVDTVLEMIRQYEANYPETLKAAYVVNAPRVFMILFGMIKPLLSAHTLGKVQIFGTDQQKWKKAILADIPSNQLPKHWGGTKEGNDEFCSNTVCMGGTIPSKYYAGGQHSDDVSDDLITYTVTAGTKFDMDIDIAVPNSTLKWTFKTDAHDVGFSVKFENKEVVPYRRVEANKTKEEGSVTCDKTGIYQIIFDNTYSRLRSKTLHYFITILSADGIVIEDEDVATSL